MFTFCELISGAVTIHQLVLAASSPLLKKAILNIDPAGRAMDEPLTVLLPDFNTDDLNSLLPWLYGDGSDEQQPNPELVKAMSIGNDQLYFTFKLFLTLGGAFLAKANSAICLLLVNGYQLFVYIL